MRMGDAGTRFTTDLDVARSRTLDSYLDTLSRSLAIGWNGFTGRIATVDPPHPEGIPELYVMMPFAVKLDFLGKPWVTVPLEVGHDEIGDARDAEYAISPDIVDFFRSLGFPEPQPVPLMPLHHQIAQKLHALSSPKSQRAHDLIDLQLIVRNETFDKQLVKNTCVKLFKYRKAQAWPCSIEVHEGWPRLYESQAQGLPVLENVEDAVAWARDFVRDINQS